MKADVDEIVSALRRAGTAERRSFADGYAPTALAMLGVAVPDMRAIARGVLRAEKATPAREIAALIKALVATRVFEARAVAYELLERRRDALELLGARGVEAIGKGNDNWASVDHYGVSVAGPAWRLGIVRDPDITRWARSKDRWWRRAALVATVGLNSRTRGGTGEARDVARTLAVCDRLAADPDDMVVKALSWALRELSKHDARAAETWLAAHEAVVHRRVTREVRTKLTTGRKQLRRSARGA